ncbi:MAG: hypothetical protein K0V04_18165 [Deltaproteobacteria bacterium]|nr:hypothetical protein [Deltaproteobacteria bacterium]
MSQSFFIALERRARRGWAWMPCQLPPQTDEGSEPRVDPGEFWDRGLFYVLSGVEYRVDPGDYPEPLVARPRGAPSDLSPRMSKAMDEESYIVSWLSASEVLLYDWATYERVLGKRDAEFALRYEAHEGRPYPHPRRRHHAPVDFLDLVAALEPIEDHRLLLGME